MNDKVKATLKMIRKAEKACNIACAACAEANAYVGTYMKRNVGQSPMFFLSADLSKSADLTASLAAHLRMKFEEEGDANAK